MCWRGDQARTVTCCASSSWWSLCRKRRSFSTSWPGLSRPSPRLLCRDGWPAQGQPRRRQVRSTDMSRLVVVSNRVAPITEGEPTAGGLAAGVLDALKQKGGIWFGWSGEVTDNALSPAHVERTVGTITLYTVDLSRRDYDEYYRGFANGTLWPTLHYQVGHAHFDWEQFAGYRRVNTLFAEALARLVQ